MMPIITDRVEKKRVKLVPDQRDWYENCRNRTLKSVKFFKIAAIAEMILTFGITPVVMYYWTGEPRLGATFNIRGFRESESWLVYFMEYFILLFGLWYLIFLLMFSLSIFIILSNYIIAHLELINVGVSRVTLRDQNVIQDLKEIVALHTDVLRTVKKLSDLFLVNNKTNEVLMIVGYTMTMALGEETTPVVFSAAIFVSLMPFFYAYTIEKIIKAEKAIRDRYYSLEWLEASVHVRKQLLLAMQKPKEINFAALFGNDRVCLERFGYLAENSYDVGLIFINLTKK